MDNIDPYDSYLNTKNFKRMLNYLKRGNVYQDVDFIKILQYFLIIESNCNCYPIEYLHIILEEKRNIKSSIVEKPKISTLYMYRLLHFYTYNITTKSIKTKTINYLSFSSSTYLQKTYKVNFHDDFKIYLTFKYAWFLNSNKYLNRKLLSYKSKYKYCFDKLMEKYDKTTDYNQTNHQRLKITNINKQYLKKELNICPSDLKKLKLLQYFHVLSRKIIYQRNFHFKSILNNNLLLSPNYISNIIDSFTKKTKNISYFFAKNEPQSNFKIFEESDSNDSDLENKSKDDSSFISGNIENLKVLMRKHERLRSHKYSTKYDRLKFCGSFLDKIENFTKKYLFHTIKFENWDNLIIAGYSILNLYLLNKIPKNGTFDLYIYGLNEEELLNKVQYILSFYETGCIFYRSKYFVVIEHAMYILNICLIK